LRLIRPPIARDVDDELRFHFQSRIDELTALGVTPEEARRRSEQEFGDIQRVRDDLMSIDRRVAAQRSRGEHLRDTLSDLRYAVRSLRRSPGLAAGVVLLLALGIGANAAMFTFLDTLFLRAPEGVVSPWDLRRLWTYHNFRNGPQYWPGFSYPEFEAVRDAVGKDARTALYSAPSKAKIGLGENAAEAQLSMANVAFFELTGARAELGRLYSADEDRLDGPERVAVLSHRYWANAMDGDRRAIGKSIVIAGAKYTVIGVIRAPFVGVDLDAADIWVPLAVYADGRGSGWWKKSDANGFQLLLRASPGTNDAQLEQRITATLRRPVFGWARDTATVARFGSIVRAAGPGKRLQEVEIGIRLAAVAIIVLLIACANVVNLLLGRAVQRQREVAVRLALGIGRWRLIRLLFAETMVMSLAAGVVALFVAYVAGTMLRRLLFPDVHWATSPVDWPVVSFALLVTIVATVVAGVIPARQSAGTDVTTVIKSRAGGIRGSRVRGALVISQAALSAVLLCGAALFVRSLTNVRNLDLGFSAARLITATVTYDNRSRKDDPTTPARLVELSRRIAKIPGVSHVALAGSRPIYTISWIKFYTQTDSMSRDFMPTFSAVSSGYFAASGIRLLSGNDFTDSPSGQHTVIVSETMARRAWPGVRDGAIGQCMYFGKRDAACYRVIGVVADSRESEVIEDPRPKYFLSLNDLPPEAKDWTANYVTVNAEPARVGTITSSIRSLIREQFPGGIPAIVRLSDYLEPQYRPWRLGATLFSVFGLLALVVAVIGIYSTTSYGVQQRVHEFGVRIALGARMGDVMRLVIVGGVRVVAIGVLLGIAAAIVAGRLIASLLYGVTPNDPATAAAVAVCLLVAGVAAASVPAWRAARVDPAATLKSD